MKKSRFFPNVGAVYDRPQFGGLQAFQLWAVIDRPYIGKRETHSFKYSIIAHDVSGRIARGHRPRLRGSYRFRLPGGA